MRVGFLTPNDPSKLGGVERFTTLLASGLEARGAKTEIFWPQAGHVSRGVALLGADEWLRGRWAGAQLQRSGFQADIVIGNGAFAAGVPRGRKGVTVHHGIYAAFADASRAGMSWREYVRLRYLKAQWEVLAGRGCTRVAVSRGTLEDLKRYHGVTEALLIENGVDTRHFSPRERQEARARFGLVNDHSYVLYAGRLEFRKGVDLLSELTHRFAPGEHLLIASDQPLDAPHAVHLGHIAYDEMPWLLSAVDLFALPSRYEGWSMGLLEAMACETPFVTVSVGGARDLEKEPRFAPGLLPDHDVDRFCSRVASLLKERNVAQRLGVAGRAYVLEHHASVAWIARWASLLEAIVGSPVRDHG